MKNLKFLTVALFAAAFLAIGSSGCTAQDIGDKAPDFTLQDISGNDVSLSQYQGRAVLLNFFASWCPPCRQEVPDFIELERSYKDKGFSVIGVALESLKDAKGFADRVGINYPVLIDDGKASDAYGPIRAIPTTFVIDKSGKIVRKYIGARNKETFESDIKELLK